jgi:hypothetical protein
MLGPALLPLALLLVACGSKSSTAKGPGPSATLSTTSPASHGPPAHGYACGPAASAFHTHRSKLWLTVKARVSRDLADAHGQYTHQRFIVSCTGGFTLLVVNDVSIGTRAPARVGDTVNVRGQYIWNDKGGLIHFTHHDPQGGTGGWIDEGGRQYR